MNKPQLMHRLNSQQDLCDIEPRDILRKDLIVNKRRHQIPSGQILHQHVQERLILKAQMQLHHPRTIGLSKQIPLSAYMGQLILLPHLSLDERFEGVDSTGSFLLDELDLAESALADDLDGSEVGRQVLFTDIAHVFELGHVEFAALFAFVVVAVELGGAVFFEFLPPVTMLVAVLEGSGQDTSPRIAIPCTLGLGFEPFLDEKTEASNFLGNVISILVWVLLWRILR